MSPWATIVSFPEHTWHWIVACIPAVTVVSGKVRVNPAQIIQLLIVAGLISVATAYMTISQLEVKFDIFKEAVVSEISELKSEVKQIRNDFYKPHLPGH